MSEQQNAAEIEYLRTTPTHEILGNQLFVLFQLAAMYLGEEPARSKDASLVIDMVSAMIASAGDRLGENVGLYKNALAELQQAYLRSNS
jgi:hypothetical protein